MHEGVLVFAQLMEFLPRHEFNKCVRRYAGDKRQRKFSCRDQFLCLAFAQLTFRESLRDIETCLRAMGSKLYHAGIRGKISRSTLADANQVHDWRIFADFAQVLIRRARVLYVNDPLDVELEQTVYALDPTTIDLCLSLFPWAKFRRRKGAVKLHTLIDLRGNIPCFIHISTGKMHDVNVLDQLLIEAGAFYVMDRGYVDFKRLYRFTVLRRRQQTPLGISDEQLHFAGADDCAAVQESLASRIVFQIDQATSANQSFLRHECQRGENSGLARDQRLRPRCHPEAGTKACTKSCKFSASHFLKKSPFFKSLPTKNRKSRHHHSLTS